MCGMFTDCIRWVIPKSYAPSMAHEKADEVAEIKAMKPMSSAKFLLLALAALTENVEVVMISGKVSLRY